MMYVMMLCVCVCLRLMQKVQMQLTQLKNKTDVIVPEQEVLTESLEEVTFRMHFTANHYIQLAAERQFSKPAISDDGRLGLSSILPALAMQ